MKILIFFLFTITLFSCGGPTEIDKTKPDSSVEHLKKELGITDDTIASTAEYGDSIKNTLEINDDIRVVLNAENEIEQLQFHNLSKEDVVKVLDILNFPSNTPTVEEALSIDAYSRTVDNSTHFIAYNDVGLLIIIDSAEYLSNAKKPYSLLIVYNEERFDSLRKLVK